MILSIFLCEDDSIQRQHMENIISAHISQAQGQIQLALSTGSPTQLINHLEAHTEPSSLYILDMDLQHEINGIELAKIIREYDHFGTIIFVTTHAEQSHIALRSRIEVMDYIIKGDPKRMASEVCECIDLAYNKYNSAQPAAEYFQIKSADGVQNIPIEKIICFEAKKAIPHKVFLYTHNDMLEFRGLLNEVEAHNPSFFRCHKSYVVNIENIKLLRRVQRTGEAVMKNGMIVPVGEAKISAIAKRMKG